MTVQELQEIMSQRFAAQDKMIAQRFETQDRIMSQRFAAQDKMIAQRFEAIDTRFEAIDSRFASLEKRQDRLETRMDRMETKLDRVLELVTFQRGQREFAVRLWKHAAWITPTVIALAALIKSFFL